jgi:hypothetical protein
MQDYDGTHDGTEPSWLGYLGSGDNTVGNHLKAEIQESGTPSQIK